MQQRPNKSNAAPPTTRVLFAFVGIIVGLCILSGNITPDGKLTITGFVAIALIVAFSLQLLHSFLFIQRRKRGRRRLRRDCCPKCGYPLRGLPEPRCPECGTTAEEGWDE